MDISLNELKVIAGEKGFPLPLIEKDYIITKVLYLLKDIKGIYFKGGTAINKVYLNYSRLSEDIDFTVTRDVYEVEKEIKEKLKDHKITYDKRVDQYIRLIVHYKMFHQENTIFLDLNKRVKLETEPVENKIPHFYGDYIPEFYFHTLSKKEMFAEKMAATIGRNKPRDHFDIFKIIEKGENLDLSLVRKKCKLSGTEFSIIKMFNKAKKLKNRWDEDMRGLISEDVQFEDVMKTLSKHFNLNKEKENLRKK